MKKNDHDLSFLSQPDLTSAGTTDRASQSDGQTGNPLDQVLPVTVSVTDPAAAPERSSRLVTDAQVLEWNAHVKQLVNEQRSLEASLHWAEVQLDHASLEEYQRQLNALESSADRLQGDEQKTFVEAHRAERAALLEALRLAKADQLEYERKAALLAPVKSALAQVQALLLADRLDSEQAANRLARYARLYGGGQGDSV